VVCRESGGLEGDFSTFLGGKDLIRKLGRMIEQGLNDERAQKYTGREDSHVRLCNAGLLEL
jgi:hypothetical protein